MRSGALAPGTALPPVRALATDLGISPATVAACYRSLRQRGIVETAGRNGTRIRPRPAIAGARTGRRLPVPDGVLDLSSGDPDARLLPALAPILASLSGDAGTTGYATGGPLPALLDLAAESFARDGIGDAVFGVTGGALDGIERVLLTHLRAGDRIAIEDPSWANLLDLVAALGLVPLSMPVDGAGPTPAALRAALAAGARAVVVTSRAHNPTGAAVTADRAVALRAILRGYPHVLVVEDDHAAQLSAVTLCPLVGATDSWAFVRSVSKPYGPDLRVAVIAGDEATIARVEGRQRLGTGWVSTLLQRLVVALWTDDGVARLVDRARDSYETRRTALITALADRGLAASGATGINVWLPVADEMAAVTRLRDDGYAVAPGSLYRLATPPGLRITIGPLDPDRIEPLADALARATTGVAAAPGA